VKRRSGLYALAGLLYSFPLVAADAKVDPRIFAQKAAGEAASFLVVMREQADLSGAQEFAGKQEKGRFVFEALTAQAEASQARLRADLSAGGVPYRSFYLVNMIEVIGTRALAEELASRPEVSSVAPNLGAPLSRVPEAPEPLVESRAPRPESSETIEANITKVGAPEVWSQGFTGQGIVIGMADTGSPGTTPH